MSTRNTKKLTKVAETTRFWQDVLARLCYCQCGQIIREQIAQIEDHGRKIAFLTGATKSYIKDMNPPQSLGELCLEYFEDALRDVYVGKTCGKSTPILFKTTISFKPKELLDLRRLLYHKNTTIPA